MAPAPSGPLVPMPDPATSHLFRPASVDVAQGSTVSEETDSGIQQTQYQRPGVLSRMQNGLRRTVRREKPQPLPKAAPTPMKPIAEPTLAPVEDVPDSEPLVGRTLPESQSLSFQEEPYFPPAPEEVLAGPVTLEGIEPEVGPIAALPNESISVDAAPEELPNALPPSPSQDGIELWPHRGDAAPSLEPSAEPQPLSIPPSLEAPGDDAEDGPAQRVSATVEEILPLPLPVIRPRQTVESTP